MHALRAAACVAVLALSPAERTPQEVNCLAQLTQGLQVLHLAAASHVTLGAASHRAQLRGLCVACVASQLVHDAGSIPIPVCTLVGWLNQCTC